MTLEENLDSVSPMMRTYVAVMDKRGYEKVLVDGAAACEVADICAEKNAAWAMSSQVTEFIEFPLPDGTAAIRFRIEKHA